MTSAENAGKAGRKKVNAKTVRLVIANPADDKYAGKDGAWFIGNSVLYIWGFISPLATELEDYASDQLEFAGLITTDSAEATNGP